MRTGWIYELTHRGTIMRRITTLLENSYFNFHYQESNYFYYFLQKLSKTEIFLQYDSETFLSFKLYEVSQGVLVYLRSREMALQCQIRGTTYTLTPEHMVQMSNRDRNELFNQLGVDGSQFFRD